VTPDAIQFGATIYKVQTLVDGGIRVTLDLPETAIAQATKLMQARQAGAVLEVAAVAIEPEVKKDYDRKRNLQRA
jgi:hypothetical protein